MKKLGSLKQVVVFGLALFIMGMPFFVTDTKSAEPMKVKLANLPMRAAWTPPIIALADLVNRNSALDITVSNLAGATVAVNSVVEGESEFMFSGSNTTQSFAYYGVDHWAGKPNKNFRALAVVGELYQSLVTTKGSGIKTWADLKGKKVPAFKVGVTHWMDGILEAYGFDLKKDLTYVPVQNFPAVFREMVRGRVDVNFAMPSGAMVKGLVEAKGKLHVLSVDPDKLAIAKSKRLAYFRGMTAKAPPQYLLPDTDVTPETLMLRDLTTISTRAEVPNEMVYLFVKTMLEHYKEIQKLHKKLRYFSPQTAAQVGAFPYHEGSVKAFKEAGVWTPELEKWQQGFFK